MAVGAKLPTASGREESRDGMAHSRRKSKKKIK